VPLWLNGFAESTNAAAHGHAVHRHAAGAAGHHHAAAAIAAGLDHLGGHRSPLVQVITQPISVISTLHVPIGIEHWQHIIPFIIMQQPIMPLAFIMQSCCIIMAAVLSSQVQVHFMPPLIFSSVIEQRGIMPIAAAPDIMGPEAIPAGIMPMAPIEGIPIIEPMPIPPMDMPIEAIRSVIEPMVIETPFMAIGVARPRLRQK